MKKIGLLLTLLVASLPSVGQAQPPTVYIAPQNGFETYLGAAMAKKGVPIDVVTDQTKAVYLLKAAPVVRLSDFTVFAWRSIADAKTS